MAALSVRATVARASRIDHRRAFENPGIAGIPQRFKPFTFSHR